MPKLINASGTVEDPVWVEFPEGSEKDIADTIENTVAELKPGNHVRCPLVIWQGHEHALKSKDVKIALVLLGQDDIESMVANQAMDPNQFFEIHIHFPDFKDGRGYSLARIIREQLGYKGTLRATGDITQDQLFYLARCGFDAFELRNDQNPTRCLKAFSSFSQTYQAATDQPLPLYRR